MSVEQPWSPADRPDVQSQAQDTRKAGSTSPASTAKCSDFARSDGSNPDFYRLNAQRGGFIVMLHRCSLPAFLAASYQPFSSSPAAATQRNPSISAFHSPGLPRSMRPKPARHGSSPSTAVAK